MKHTIYTDPVPVRKIKLAFGEKVKCQYPNCRLTFVPKDRAKTAYQKKGWCFCRKHQAEVEMAKKMGYR